MSENIQELTNKLKSKLIKIKNQNEKIKLFNYKMECFLASIDAYSIEKPLVPEPRVSYKKPACTTNTTSINFITEPDCTTIDSPSICEVQSSIIHDTKHEFINRALNDKILKKNNKSHVIKILNLLYNNKDEMQWDDIIKMSGVPKYKCVEILNCLMKTNPPLIIKSRHKGLACRLNFEL